MTMEFQPYPFEKLNSLICGIQTSGERISLTIGEPQFNTPKNICEILRQKVEFLNKYPKTAGEGFLKDSMLNFLARRFNVALNQARFKAILWSEIHINTFCS